MDLLACLQLVLQAWSKSCAACRVRCCSRLAGQCRPGLGTGFGTTCNSGAGFDVASNRTAFACASWRAAASAMTCSSLASPRDDRANLVRRRFALVRQSGSGLKDLPIHGIQPLSELCWPCSKHSPMADSDVATGAVARTWTTRQVLHHRGVQSWPAWLAVRMRSVLAASMPSVPSGPASAGGMSDRHDGRWLPSASRLSA